MGTEVTRKDFADFRSFPLRDYGPVAFFNDFFFSKRIFALGFGRSIVSSGC